MMENKVVEEVVIVMVLIGTQALFAGNSVLQGYLLSVGLTPFTIVIGFSFVISIALSPFAVFFERSTWPKQLTLKLIIQILLISFLGVTIMQVLFIKGIGLASPALATAMPNLAPGLIFVFSWILRLEKVDLSCLYSKIKIVGTILCIVGAIIMGLSHSVASSKPNAADHNTLFDKNKIIGFLYLGAAVLVLSTNVILQATTLRDMPAPMSLCVITSFFGMVFSAICQLVQYRALQWGSPGFTVKEYITFSILGGALGGVSISACGWAMGKRGPVLVSMFSPVATIVTIAFSIITLKETIELGSVAGMIIIFIGLYVYLWAQRKEMPSIVTIEDLENSAESK